MVRSSLLAALVVGALAAPLAAQTKWTDVPRASSQIRLQLPGLTAPREQYQWSTDDQYIGSTHVGFQAAANGDFPRGQSYLIRAFADASVQSRNPLDEANIKKYFGDFGTAKLTVDPKALPDPMGDREVRRFGFETVSCVAFQAYPSGVDRMRLGGGSGTVAVIGYYCGPPGVPLSDNDIQWVLWGNEFAMPPNNAFVRLAAQPATPPSDRLRPTGGAGARAGLTQAEADQINGGIAAYNRKDYAAALAAWRPHAQQGNAVSQTGLGLLYMNGQGVAKNPAEAVTWFRKAAEQGDVNAEYQLGRSYREGSGVARNFGEAMKWLRKAADQGSAFAHYEVGVLYANGQGVAKNDAEAKRWMDLALAKLGPEDAGGRAAITRDRDQIAARMAAPGPATRR